MVAQLLLWWHTRNLGSVKLIRTFNTGTGYLEYCAYEMKKVWIKSHMMKLTQLLHYLWLCVCNKNLSLYKLVFIKNHFNTFVRNIRILLNTIPLYLHFSFIDRFFHFTWLITPCLHAVLDKCFWNYRAKLISSVEVEGCIIIYVSYIFARGSFTVEINWKRTLLSVELMPPTTSMMCPGALTPR